MIAPPTQDDRPRSHLEFFLKIQHAHGQKMIDPPGWQTKISHRIFLKIEHAHGQKMIDPPGWQTKISPRIFFKNSTCTWAKDDWPPTQDDRPGSHLEFLKIQYAHGQKMIAPPHPGWQTKISPRIFFKDSTCTWSKDDWPPWMTDQDLT